MPSIQEDDLRVNSETINFRTLKEKIMQELCSNIMYISYNHHGY